MKAFLIITTAILLIGCDSLPEELEKCAYCHGKIFWHKTHSSSPFSEIYARNYEARNGEEYHPWCFKLTEE